MQHFKYETGQCKAVPCPEIFCKSIRGRSFFSFCSEPETLGSFQWLLCYLTTIKHSELYKSVFVVLLLLAITAPVSLIFGFTGAMAARSRIWVINGLGRFYIAIVRGVPDIAFFMFFVIALDQLLGMGPPPRFLPRLERCNLAGQ